MSATEAFANRLRKNARHWDKWARRQGLSCYRIYDRDLPEFPLAIDRYADQLHLQVFETQWQATEHEYQAWWQAVVNTVAEVLEVPITAIHGKMRRRQKGSEQYEKQDVAGKDFVVEEQGARFWVNLERYLDTGLFLDHRNTRAMVRERAAGKRFLNLFAYTGSFTVYAALGGARSSVTVDMSNTYQEWSRRNFVLNDLDLKQHSLVRADVMEWLRESVERPERYDIIVMDPPSFSNSKKMIGVLDVQRDHAWMVHQCMKLLNPGGELFFSTNLRSFRLEPTLADWYMIDNISHKTVPEDFRNKKIHQCWVFTARE